MNSIGKQVHKLLAGAIILVTVIFIFLQTYKPIIGPAGQLHHSNFYKSFKDFEDSDLEANYGTDGTVLQDWELDTSRDYVLTPPATNYVPTTRYYEFEIREYTTGIGGRERVQILINGKYPGPLIEAVEGDVLVVHVVNRSNEPTTIHFHGMLMNGTNFLDGVPGIHQCAIKPGQEFTYRFPADTPGTFWYHSHWPLQYLKGVVGPLVIHELPENTVFYPDSVTKFDSEIVMMLTDVYDDNVHDLLEDYYEPYLGGKEPVPRMTLFQGKVNPAVPVQRGLRYRVRLINASSYLSYKFSIDNHLIQIIEADGLLTEPYYIPYIPISAGQRYSIALNTTPTSLELDSPGYWIRAMVQQSELEGTMGEVFNEKLHGLAMLSYPEHTRLLIANKDAEPESKPWAGAEKEYGPFYIHNFDVTSLHPIVDEAIPEPDLTYVLDATMVQIDGIMHGAFNDTVYKHRTRGNSLVQYLQPESSDLKPDESHHQHEVPAEIKVGSELELLSFDEITVVDFYVRNLDDGPHPFHLHGHNFWVMAKGMNYQFPSPSYTSSKPIKRDTVVISEGGWAQIRFVTDNPGHWIFHCHNAWHSVTGMVIEFVSLPDRIHNQRASRAWFQLCDQ